jgi:hypothetical protein
MDAQAVKMFFFFQASQTIKAKNEKKEKWKYYIFIYISGLSHICDVFLFVFIFL